MPAPIVLVTGGNRGIGLEACRQLAARFAEVVMACRDPAKGETARATVVGHAERIRVEQVAVDDPASIRALSARLPRLDVLVNNAGMFSKRDAAVLDVGLDVVTETIATNVHGPLLLAQAFAAQLRASARGRIVNVSSGMGQFEGMGSDHAAYRLSKTALDGVTAMLAHALPGIAVNAMCPGWVRTDMGGPNAPRTVAQGADTIVWLALDADQSQTGRFWRDRAVCPW